MKRFYRMKYIFVLFFLTSGLLPSANASNETSTAIIAVTSNPNDDEVMAMKQQLMAEIADLERMFANFEYELKAKFPSYEEAEELYKFKDAIRAQIDNIHAMVQMATSIQELSNLQDAIYVSRERGIKRGFIWLEFYGQTFTADTEEGVTLIYRIVSEEEKTVTVGYDLDYNEFFLKAFDPSYRGSVASVTIPETVNGYKVVSIGKYAFYSTGIKSIVLPKTIRSIGRSAIEYCSSLEKVYSYITDPFPVSQNFQILDYQNDTSVFTSATLYVPAGTKALYEATEGWCNFQNIVEMEAEPSADIAIDATHFPDENFRAWLLSQDYGQDGKLTQEEIDGITEINVSVKGIADLTGIELFTNLTDLNCSGNQLTSLDVSNLVLLKWLDCYNNLLSSLDVTKNVALKGLSCNYNQLTELDVTKNIELVLFDCSHNHLKSLDVSKDVSLNELYCLNNQIKESGMEALISSLPSVPDGKLYAINPPEWGEGNEITPAQVTAAKTKGWKVFQWDNEKRTWIDMEGSPTFIDPLGEDETVTFGEESGINEDTDLAGNVIGNIFYNINRGDGNYDPEEGCFTVMKATADEVMQAMEGQDIFGEEFKSHFTGIVFKVPAGNGAVKITAETTGNMTLKVKVGNGAPIEMELEGKLKASFPYQVSEPTLVYLYAGQTAAGVKGLAPVTDAEGTLKIYGIELDVTEDAIEGLTSSQKSEGNIYNLSGQRLSKPQRGVNIMDGKKVVVK